jgi:Xaa-Pro aminopeptidase
MGFDQQEFEDRHRRIRERMAEAGFDALIAYSNPKSRGCVRYLSNYFVRFVGEQNKEDGSYAYFGSCAVLFPREGEPVLLTDQIWDEVRAKEVSIFPETRYARNFGTEFGRILREQGYGTVGIDNWFIFPAMHYLPLTELAPNATFKPTQLIEDVYKIKSPAEIEYIRLAEAAAVQAVAAGCAAVGVGVSEYDFAIAAETAARTYGDLELAGGSIVAGGANTATGVHLPTHENSHVMERGEWAMFDICPSYGGYAGDICRMVVAGKLTDLDPRLMRLYNTTLEMNERAIEAVRPGVSPLQLNRIAEKIADDAGYLELKIGLLGHSLGLDMHDHPDYYWDDTPLEEDMTFTIEPCLLMPGLGGTRVEDVVRVTADGCEVLTAAAPKELRGSED